MKKLIFAIVGATMVGGAFAAGPVDGWEVYNFTTTLKTTKAVKADLKAKSNDLLEEDVTGFVRKQATVRIDGVVWGHTYDGFLKNNFFDGFRSGIDGALFWNATDKQGFDDFDNTGLVWDFVNRIDTTAKKTEGFWNAEFDFIDGADHSSKAFELCGAGFGTAARSGVGYVPSISGSVVGVRCAGDASDDDVYVWPLFDCDCDCANSEYAGASVAFGTWSLKFNDGLAKKVAAAKGMTSYIFSTICKIEEFQDAAEAYYHESGRETDTKIAHEKLAAYKEDLVNLEADYATNCQNIVAYDAIIAKCDATNVYLVAQQKAAQDAYDCQADATTNSAWYIWYKNPQNEPVQVKGKGLNAFAAKVAEFKEDSVKITSAAFDYAGETLFFKDNAACEKFCEEETDLTASLEETLADANDAVAENARVRQMASQGILDTKIKLAELDYENAKPQLNAAIGKLQATVDKICANAHEKLPAYEAEMTELDRTLQSCIKNIVAYQDIIKKCDATNGYLKAVQKAAQDAYNYQLDATTNSAWSITYENASGDPLQKTGNGLASFTACVNELKTFTITDGYFYYAGMEVGFVGNEGCELFCKDQAETTTLLKKSLDEANAAVTANTLARQLASQGLVIETARLEKFDINHLQQLKASVSMLREIVGDTFGQSN